MLKRTSLYTLALLVGAVALFFNEWFAFSGTGWWTAGDPYIITSCAEFLEINDNRGAAYLLSGDLDCTANGSGIMIGSSSNQFTGSFDGGGFTLLIDIATTGVAEKVALFRYTNGATITHLVVSGTIDAPGTDQVGALVGYAQSSTKISLITGTIVINADRYVGGLVGETNASSITWSSAVVSLSGAWYMGGLVGYAGSNSSIDQTTVTGTIQAQADFVGGLVGYSNNADISNSSAYMIVAGNYYIGGLVGTLTGGSTITNTYARADVAAVWNIAGGLVGDATDATVAHSYALATVTGQDDVGGLIGRDAGSTVTISGSFWDTDVSWISSSAGGTGLTTSQMHNVDMFSGADRDIELSMTGRNDGYPYLSREIGESSPMRYISPYAYLHMVLTDHGQVGNDTRTHHYTLEFSSVGRAIDDGVVSLAGNISLTNLTLSGSTPSVSMVTSGSMITRTGVALSAGTSGSYDLLVRQETGAVYVYTASLTTLAGTYIDTGNATDVVSSTVTVPVAGGASSNLGGGGWGWGGGAVPAANATGTTSTGDSWNATDEDPTAPSTPETQQSISGIDGASVEETVCTDTDDLTAYAFAYQYEITTMPSCGEANLGGYLVRKHAAKMMSNFAMNVLEKTPDTTKVCSFTDMGDEDEEMQHYAELACQLWLMGLDASGTPKDLFEPNEIVNKAQLATILSRMLYGETHNTTDECRYCDHVTALQEVGIITVVTDLLDPLRRGRAMLMLMRVAELE